MESFQEKCDVDKEPNKLQMSAGQFEITHIISNEVPYSMLDMERDRANVEMEMVFCGLLIDGGWKKDVLQRLKLHEGNDKVFVPRCFEVDFQHIWDNDVLKKQNVE
jgi:hypothetical protein